MDAPPVQDPVSLALSMEETITKKDVWDDLFSGRTMTCFCLSLIIGIVCFTITLGLWIGGLGSRSEGAYIAVGIFGMVTLCAFGACTTLLCEVACPKTGSRAYSRAV